MDAECGLRIVHRFGQEETLKRLCLEVDDGPGKKYKLISSSSSSAAAAAAAAADSHRPGDGATFLSTPVSGSAPLKRLIAVASDIRGPSFLFGWAVVRDGGVGGSSNKKVDDLPAAAGAAGGAAGGVKLQQVCCMCCDYNSPCCQLAVSPDQQFIAIGLANVVLLQHVLYTGQQQLLLRQQALTSGNFEATIGDLLAERLQQQEQQQQQQQEQQEALDMPFDVEEFQQQQQQQNKTKKQKGPHDEL
ncbi:hypothetical protein, conserved [Eimeria maxima]|uniref:WD domain, G-beta repeat-containing protein n=1 Tax=Eimeria maxima TaxID=5804 RepID=U6LYR0_EIMMA|nr:hypothetical protein, conserved [Eimeria maxima]CDJ57072.1 hypothetical protein, conserved [Eimeria maxima]